MRPLLPLTWIVGFESNDEVAVRLRHQCITSHGRRWEVRLVRWVVLTHEITPSKNNLKIVSVEMKRMRAWVVVVEYDLDDLILA